MAIVGRPNVGKSALFNRITGSNLAIVYDYPGVTRDRMYTRAVWGESEFVVVDTGGLMSEAVKLPDDDKRMKAVRGISDADLPLVKFNSLSLPGPHHPCLVLFLCPIPSLPPLKVEVVRLKAKSIKPLQDDFSEGYL